MESMENKSVIITGGSKGIGKGIALQCAKEGAKILIAALNEGPLKAATEEIKAAGGTIDWIVADTSKPEDWARIVEKAKDLYGTIDYVFSNAGISFNKTIFSARPEEWEWIMNVNFMGHLNCLQATLPVFMEQENGGHYVFTASFASFASPATMVPYACSKAATMALAEGLQNELNTMGIDKIKLSIVMPAFVASDIQHNEASQPESVRSLEDNSNEMDKAVWAYIDQNLAAGDTNGTISIETAGQRIVDQVKRGLFYVYTHKGFVKSLAVEKMSRMILDQPPLDPSPSMSSYYERYPKEF